MGSLMIDLPPEVAPCSPSAARSSRARRSEPLGLARVWRRCYDSRGHVIHRYCRAAQRLTQEEARRLITGARTPICLALTAAMLAVGLLGNLARAASPSG